LTEQVQFLLANYLRDRLSSTVVGEAGCRFHVFDMNDLLLSILVEGALREQMVPVGDCELARVEFEVKDAAQPPRELPVAPLVLAAVVEGDGNVDLVR